MASTDKELEVQLTEAGNKLLNRPSSVEELLSLLDEVENCLSRVEQSPAKSMQSALAPSQQALVADQLFKHSDINVKVAVASCISEITRITAPEAPYDDDQMKDVFQLIVSSFENLADKSGRSYGKRTSILETVAKVRSCVVMLDLECEALIIEMFEHFLKSIRDYHPDIVFSSMETIMSLVLEESEDISPELLSPLLDSVKRNNEEVLPIARKLGEKVLESCATKVKPYLRATVKSLGISLDEYSDIVSSICQEMTETAQQNDVHSANENKVEELKPAGASSDDAIQVNTEIVAEAASPKQDATIGKTPKSPVSNGVTQTRELDSLADLNCSQNKEDDSDTYQAKNVDSSSNAEPDILVADKAGGAENKAEQTNNIEGEKSNSSTKSTEPFDSSHIDADKEEVTEPSKKVPKDKSDSKDVLNSPHKVQSVEATVDSDDKKEIDGQPSPAKALEGVSKTLASPSVSESIHDGSPRNDGKPTNKESFITETAPSAGEVPKTPSQAASETGAGVDKHSGRKAPSGISNEDKTPSAMDASRKESGAASESEVKPAKQSSKKVDTTSNSGDASSVKQSADKKQNVLGKVVSEKNDGQPANKESFTKEAAPSAGEVPKTPSQAASETEAKVSKRSGRKAPTSISNEDKTSSAMDVSKKESGTASESEAKPAKQSSKKVDASSNNADGSSNKQSADKKQHVRGKVVSEKNVVKSSTKDETKEKVSSLKFVTKSIKDEDRMEESPKTSAKRKRTPIKEKGSDTKEYGQDIIGLKVRVWWPRDRAFYEGVIDSYDSSKKKHLILYNDGDQEILNLKKERWEIIKDDSEQDEGEAAEEQSPDSLPEMPQKKKVKSNSEQSTKQGKTDVSPIKSGVSSSKSKSSSAKSGQKLKEVGKADGKSTDDAKAARKLEDDKSNKTKDGTPKSGSRSIDVTSKTGIKIKTDDAVLSKTRKSKEDSTSTSIPKPSKSKQETPKATSNTKGKSAKSGGKSNVNGAGKAKEAEDDADSADSGKKQEDLKVKSATSPKGQETSRSSKKRRRGT